MSLSDRLQQARTQRLIEAGVLPSEFALKPEIDVQPEVAEDTSQGLFAPITIEVQPTGLHLVAPAPGELTDLPEGQAASICPNCNSIGHLDMVDLVGHTVHLTCEACGTMWQVRNEINQTIVG
ncbi:MAG: hypothetical protein QOI95_951 [Acidimicrobiaceae bacterium]|jgi:hypothetical protein